jgi:putative oxidoreductase
MMAIENSLNPWAPKVLSILRIVAALLFVEHGAMKLFSFPAPMGMPLELFSLIGLAGILEFFGGLILAIGLFSRAIAFVLSGEMAFAYFMEHFPKSFFPALNMGDGAILFCFIFSYIVFAGPGPWSADAIRKK